MEIISSAVLTTVLLSALGWLFRNLIYARLSAAVKHEYEIRIKNLEAELQRQNNETFSKLQNELDILREKELGGYKDKIQIYRLVIDVWAELYSNLQSAFKKQVFDQSIIDRYNLGWVRCYGYLSMLAPQGVMDAFDQLNDYILKVITGRTPLQEWAVTRRYALAFLNSVRKDVGLVQSPVEYRGDL